MNKTVTHHPIEWREDRYSTHGYVGGVMLFTYFWDATRPMDASDEKPWAVTTRLPGFKTVRAVNPEGCRAIAEKMLRRFIERIGAV